MLKTAKLLLIATALACNAQASVLVLQVSGEALTETRTPVTTLMTLVDGTQISLLPGASVVAVDLASGREYLLSGNRKFIIGAGQISTDDGLIWAGKPGLAGRLPDVKLGVKKAAQASIVMRSMGPAQLSRLSPSATEVSSTQPVLRWDSQSGASQYRVTVVDDSGGLVWSTLTPALEQRLASDKLLQPGRSYAWKLEALGPSEVLGEVCSRFHVLDAASMARLQKLAPQNATPLAGRVLYGSMLSQAGALQEAADHWRALSNDYPADAVIKMLADQELEMAGSQAQQRQHSGGAEVVSAACVVTR